MLQNMSILYVEDHTEENHLLCELLSPLVKKIDSAYNGEEGLTLYKKIKPDIVITDIQMPKMDGLTMAEEIKKIHPDQNIIILSAFDFNNYFQRSIDIPVSGYILKPIMPENLYSQLNKCAKLIQIEKDNQEHKKRIEFNEKYLNSIFDTSNDIIITTFGDIIEKANSSMFQFTGYNGLDEFKEDYDCICDLFVNKVGYLQKDMYGSPWIEYIINNPDIYHKAIIKKGDKEHIFGVNAKKLELDKNQRYLAILTDITKLIEQEKAIKEQDELLMAQSRQAAMGEMIGMIAHQWKQPLSVLSMIASNQKLDIELESEFKIDRLREDADEITQQIDYLAQTIDDFRDFLKPHKNKDQINLNDLLSRTMNIIGKLLKSNNIEVILNSPEDIEIETYSKELIQVLINILNNSKDALLENSIKDPSITLSVKLTNKTLCLIIEDNARGVPNNILPHIFEPYFTTKGDNGTGIGLYMCKNIVEKNLKGTISADNTNNGLSMTITLPYRYD